MSGSADFPILLDSRQSLGLDFFGGWEPEDIELLQKYAATVLRQKENCVTNFLGVYTSLEFFSWFEPKTGFINSKLPFPDDGLHAEAIEYVALCKAFELANKKTFFTSIELGASFGPWITASAKIAERFNLKPRLVGVEATLSGIKMMKKHLEANEVKIPDDQIEIIQACVSDYDGEGFFPDCDVGSDNGAQISSCSLPIDYRGLAIQNKKISVISLQTILKKYESVDFLHVDIQGTEKNLFHNSLLLNELDKKVSLIFCATHSREAEAKILGAMHKRGWSLYRERPCRYVFDPQKPSVEGMTIRDGGMIFINNKLNLTL